MRTIMDQSLQVTRFGQVRIQRQPELRLRPARSRAIVRVEYASVGITDAMAARGDYLLRPVPGFTTGYDFVGIVESLPSSEGRRLRIGQRVTGILPAMGAHTTRLAVSPNLLVPIPDGLRAPDVATIPLDAVTASFALRLAEVASGGSVLIQGSGGSVGSWLVQLARLGGFHVYGTVSERSEQRASSLGAHCYNYADEAWKEQLLAGSNGGVDAAIDHTGDTTLPTVVRKTGTIVRTAFGGRHGRQRQATLRGSVSTLLRSQSKPREVMCSLPLSLRTRTQYVRRHLEAVLAKVADGTLYSPVPELVKFSEAPGCFARLSKLPAGRKLVLAMPDVPSLQAVPCS